MVIVAIVDRILWLLMIAIFIRAILSWVPIGPRHPVVTFFNQVTEPVLQPIRRFMPRMGAMDLSPLIALFLIFLIRMLLSGAF